MLAGREVTVGYKWVKGEDGKYRRHSVARGMEGHRPFFDLTVERRRVSFSGFERLAMGGIVPNETIAKGGFSLAEIGGALDDREAMAEAARWIETVRGTQTSVVGGVESRRRRRLRRRRKGN